MWKMPGTAISDAGLAIAYRNYALSDGQIYDSDFEIATVAKTGQCVVRFCFVMNRLSMYVCLVTRPGDQHLSFSLSHMYRGHSCKCCALLGHAHVIVSWTTYDSCTVDVLDRHRYKCWMFCVHTQQCVPTTSEGMVD